MFLHAGLDPVLAGRDLTTEPRNVRLAFCEDRLRAGPHLCRCARCGEQRIWLIVGRWIIIRGCCCVSGGRSGGRGSGGTDRGASCSGTPSRVGRGDDRRPAIVGATVVVGAAAIIGTATAMVAVGTVGAAVLAPAHQTLRVEFPLFIAVRAVPVSRIVVPFVLEAH